MDHLGLSDELSRVQSDMRRFHCAFGFGDILDPGETRFGQLRSRAGAA
jgi:hypothetical protein